MLQFEDIILRWHLQEKRHSTQWKWLHFFRNKDCQSSDIVHIYDVILKRLLPAILNQEMDVDTIAVLTLPASLGGIDIVDSFS
ncbi:hypothetical protein GJ496_010170 [Pomphorhynchus laevis]|nr:hypothetical protein GJ496_010168 [Pomphorhynchus laevis]KAI0989330.1 hypothetical protein GJ496_010170 [Pomphorhynchus laevis]